MCFKESCWRLVMLRKFIQVWSSPFASIQDGRRGMIRAVQLAVVCVGLTVGVAGQVQAGVITYTNASTFSTAAGSLTLEDFNSSSLERFVFGTAYQFNGFTITASADPRGTGPGAGIANTTASDIDGTQRLVWGRTFGPNQGGWGPQILFTFDTAVTAFGFDWNDRDTTDGYELVVLGNSIGSAASAVPYPRVSGSGFFGLVNDTPFSSVLLRQVQRGGFVEDMSMDNVRFSTAAVPEPATLAVFGIGACIAGFGAARRRRSEKRQSPTA